MQTKAILLLLLFAINAFAQRKAVSMTGWYKHANFYQSQDARVMIPNAQTKQLELAFQFTPEYELALGNQAYQQLVQGGAGVINDPEVQGYFERLVQKLITTTPGGPNLPYRVLVLNAPQVVNAVTPPGYVIVYSGLIGKVGSEAELVAVLAHEIAHNYAHHVVRQIGKQAYLQASINAMAGAVQRKNVAVQTIANIGAQIGGGLFLKAYSRYEEKEADLYGTHLMYNAGYNPTAMSQFFLRLYQDRPKQPFKLLSTHPNDPDRANYVSDYLEGFPLNRELTVDSDQFRAIQQRLGFNGGELASAASQPLPPVATEIPGPGIRNSRPAAGGGGSKVRMPRLADETQAPPPASTSGQLPPVIPEPPSIPDPPPSERTSSPPPARNPVTTRRAPHPVPPQTQQATRQDPPPANNEEFPALDRSKLDAFIRQTVPAGAKSSEELASNGGRRDPVPNPLGGPRRPLPASAANREGAIEITGGDQIFEERCPPGKCGELRWDGEAKTGLVVTIDGNRVTSGALEGGLPGTPVRVVNDMPEDLTFLEQPSARNGWKKLSFRLKFDGGFTVILRWRAI